MQGFFISIAPRLNDHGRVDGFVLRGRPLGALRTAYADLSRSHDALKTAQALLVRNEKRASLGRLLAGVAHELNNPISFVYANTHAMERYISKFETCFARVQDGASRDELIALRRDLRLDCEVANLREAINGARDGAARVRDIVDDLRRLSSDGSGGKLVLDLAEPGGDRAVLTVADNGPGVSADLRTSIFDPFFTTKAVGRGTGLGLSISHKIAQEHGGTLALCDTPEGGACFRLTLPAAEAP